MCRRPPRRRDPDVRAPPRFYSGSPRSPDRAAWCSRRLEPATYSCIVSRPDSGPSRASRSRHHLLYATPSAAASSRRPRLDLTAARRGGEREHGTGRAAQHHRHGGDSEAEPHPVQRGAEYKGVGSVRKPGRFSHRAPPLTPPTDDCTCTVPRRPDVMRRQANQPSVYQVPRPAPWRKMWPALVSRLK